MSRARCRAPILAQGIARLGSTAASRRRRFDRRNNSTALFVFLLVREGQGTDHLLLAAHSGTQHAQTLITALFNQTDEDKLRKDFSYDFYDGQGVSRTLANRSADTDVSSRQPKVDNDPFAEIVREKLSRIFHRKGAVSGIDGPLLMPDSSIYGARNPVRLLDADGTVVVLPYLLNIPFLRMCAREPSLTRLKRWTIAPVYRSAPGGGVGLAPFSSTN